MMNLYHHFFCFKVLKLINIKNIKIQIILKLATKITLHILDKFVIIKMHNKKV